MYKKTTGFTLVELMIVLSIIAMLFVMLIPDSKSLKSDTKDTGVTLNVIAVRDNIELMQLSGEAVTKETLDSLGIKNPYNGYAIQFFEEPTTLSPDPILTQDMKIGEVIVYKYTDGYLVYGISSNNMIINTARVLKK